MSSIRLFNRQTMYIVVAITLALGAFVPALASAAQVTERSIALSSSSVSATNVTYNVSFTPTKDAEAFVIDFCTNSPVPGETCDAPTGFSASAAATSGGFTIGTLTNPEANKIAVVGTITAPTPVSVVLTGLVNPSTTGPLYARIATFDTEANANAYTSEVPGANVQDEGGVAMYITPTIGVSGVVLESMTFCVAKNEITANCASASDEGNAPVLKLGETVGDVTALTPGVLSTGTINTQISTNASGGAIVSLKNSVPCGGMMRVGASICDITPALTDGVTGGQAKFGVKTATATSTSGVADASGTLQPVTDSGYNNLTYALNYLNTNATGVTSPYGDPFLNTDGHPVNNKNMALTFGASISNQTPAGLYSADLSLIATGTF